MSALKIPKLQQVKLNHHHQQQKTPQGQAMAEPSTHPLPPFRNYSFPPATNKVLDEWSGVCICCWFDWKKHFF